MALGHDGTRIAPYVQLSSLEAHCLLVCRIATIVTAVSLRHIWTCLDVACSMIASDALDDRTDYEGDGDNHGDDDGTDHQDAEVDGGIDDDHRGDIDVAAADDDDDDDTDGDSTVSVRRKASLRWSSLGRTGSSSRTRAP